MKTFLSIGTGPGMGIATAERFAKEGYQVILSARNTTNLQALEEQLKSGGYSVEYRVVDASCPKSVAALVREVTQEFGSIDVLHYNAASMRKQTVLEQDNETFNQDLAVNIGGAMSAIKAVVPGMTDTGAGTILLTGGGFALAPQADFLSLSLGKAGIRALALGLFESLMERNIHIATVTVATFVNPNTKESAVVADKFWALANEPKSSWSVETQYAG